MECQKCENDRKLISILGVSFFSYQQDILEIERMEILEEMAVGGHDKDMLNLCREGPVKKTTVQLKSHCRNSGRKIIDDELDVATFEGN